MPSGLRLFPLLAALAAPLPSAAAPGPLLPPDPALEPRWTWAPLELGAEIRVAPLLLVGPLPALSDLGYLGEALDGGAARLREARNAQVLAVPWSFSEALPGELASALPAGWRGHLSDAKVPASARAQLVAGLDGRRSFEEALQLAADRLPGEIALFHWVSGVEAWPLAASTAPGSTLRAAERLVYVDQHTDPVLVEATAGLALVSTDGEVFLRYEDRYRLVITGSNTAARAGRDLARQLVLDLRPMLGEASVAALLP